MLAASGERTRHNLLDHRRLGVGVVMHLLPISLSELPFGALVELTVGGVAAQPVAKAQHAPDLLTARRENMQVDIGIRTLEHAVLKPLRLADGQHVARRLQCWHVSRFVCRVWHYEHDIYERFGSQPWHRGRASVFEQHHALSARRPDALDLTHEDIT